MKLYYCPGACSLSAHIVAREAGIELKLEKVDLQTKKSGDGGTDFTEINRKSYVPALQLDDGAVLTEVPAVVQYLAEKKPHSGLAPAAGTLESYRLQEMLGFINSEFHGTYSDLFNPAMEAVREVKLGYLKKRYAFIEQRLASHSYLVGDGFTAADAYLFTVTNWAGYVKLELSSFPNLQAYQKRIAARPAVQAAMEAEGLLQ